MRWFFAIQFIIFGALFFSLTIDQMGILGHLMMKIIGVGSFFVAGFIVKGKKEKVML